MFGRVHWQEQFEAIGTQWMIDIFDAPADVQRAQLLWDIHERIDAFDQVYSRFRADSLVTEMSKRLGMYVLPQDATPLIELYQELYQATGGAFTPLIGRTLEQAGYDAQYSLKPQKLSVPQKLEEVMSYDVATRTVSLTEPALLDFGAAGKGYLVDLVSELMESHGVADYMVDAGSDIRHRGTEVVTVGLENPNKVTQAIGIATVANQSLCASAGNRRKWEGFHHIINPHTLQSPQEVLATWVTAGSTLVADGIATALFLSSPQTIPSHFQFEYLILYSDFSIKRSAQFPAELFTT